METFLVSSSLQGIQRYSSYIYVMFYITHYTLKTAHVTWSRIIYHYCDVIMGVMASQITSLTIVYSNVYSGADQRKYQSSASLAFVWGIRRWPVNSPHKGPVKLKMFPFDDVIIDCKFVA